jgi:uncharacterized protein YqhQ
MKMQNQVGKSRSLHLWKYYAINSAVRPIVTMIIRELSVQKSIFLTLIAPFWTTASEEILVGGQAVFEGVMMRAPNSYSIAVRRSDQSISVKKETLPQPADRKKAWKWPILRGMATLGQALVLGIRALKFSTDQALEDLAKTEKDQSGEGQGKKSKELSSWVIGLNILLALVFFVLLFKLLPLFLANLLKNHFPIFGNPLLFSLVDGIVRMAIFLGYILGIAQLKDIRRVFEYHGAEHKVVFTFEAGDSLTIENARGYSTLHPRCGTSFLMVVMLISIIVYAFIPFDSFLWKLLSRIILIPFIAGISYEIIRYSAKRKSQIFKWLTLPGIWLQKVTTREPGDDQLEIAIRALHEALSLENGGEIRAVL